MCILSRTESENHVTLKAPDLLSFTFSRFLELQNVCFIGFLFDSFFSNYSLQLKLYYNRGHRNVVKTFSLIKTGWSVTESNINTTLIEGHIVYSVLKKHDV